MFIFGFATQSASQTIHKILLKHDDFKSVYLFATSFCKINFACCAGDDFDGWHEDICHNSHTEEEVKHGEQVDDSADSGVP